MSSLHPVPCRTCTAPVYLARLTTTGNWGVFDAEPVDALFCDSNRHWWLSGRSAAPIAILVDRIQMTGEVSAVRADRLARTDYPWHRFHDCPNRHDDQEARA